MTENDDQNKQNQYFKLMEVVGTEGKYQNILLLLFCVLVFEVGSLSLGNPYYFAVAPYVNCQQPYNSATQCNNYVCSLPLERRSQYLEPQISQLHTLGNQFGDFHCEKSDIISTAMGMFFLGSIIGYICMGSLVDNLGRKLTFNICLLVGTIGNLFVLVSPNLVLAQIGLFLMGFGLQNAFNLCFYFFSQQFSNKKRQIGAVIIQSCFCLGGLFTILWFYIFKRWKIIFWICYFTPIFIITVISFRYLKETPQFLIKRYRVEQIREQLRFISILNNRKTQFENSEYTTIQSLSNMKEQYIYQAQVSNKKFFTFRDLFKYRSLRTITLLIGLVTFSVDFLYYAPLMLIDQFGFNFYVNGIIINISELITYAFSYFYITKFQRKKLALYIFVISFICSFILLFIHQNTICQQNCWNARLIIQLVVVFVLRFCISLEFQVLLIYINELYPIQVAGIGLSYASIIGTLPNVFIPELINIFNRHNYNIMILFCIISIFGLVGSKFLKETKGLKLRQKIQQFGLKQNKKDNKQVQLVQEIS